MSNLNSNIPNYGKIDIAEILRKGIEGQRKILDKQLANGGFLVYQNDNGEEVQEFSNRIIILRDKDGNKVNDFIH